MRLSLSTSAIGPLYRPAAWIVRSGVALSVRSGRGLMHWLTTRPAHVLLCGGLSGVYLLTFIQRFWSVFGTSLPMVAGVALAIATACQVAFLRASRAQGANSTAAGWAMAHLVLAAWVLVFGGLAEGSMRIVQLVSIETLASRGFSILFSYLAAAALLTLPVYLIARLPFLHPRGQDEDVAFSNDLQNYAAGLACGLVLVAVIGAPFAGVRNCALITAAISTGLFVVGLLKRRTARIIVADTTFQSDPSGPIAIALAITATIAFGGLAAVAGRMLHQLMPAAGYLLYAEWAAVLLGFALGSRRAKSEQGTFSAACLLSAAIAAMLLCGERLLIEFMLAVNSRVSIVWLSMFIRCGLGALFFFPIGLAWGKVGRSGQRSAVSGQLFRFYPLVFAVGYLLTRIVGVPRYSLPILLVAVSWLLASMAVIGWVSTRTFPRRWLARTAIGVAACLLASAGVLRDFGAGDQTARLLFSTNVFLARQNGLKSRFLPVLDDGRLVASRPGDRGTLTVWKYRGSLLQLRESGVPKAVISTRPGSCPEYSPEKMHTILPLVLHDRPRNVLLLGLGGGDGLATCVTFPVPAITCVEDDGGLIDALRKVVWPSCAIDPLADERVSLLKIDPALAVANSREKYDVIISRPDQPALWQTAPYFTREFYQRASRLLSDGGLFCQRFQQVDFGPNPLRTVARTMRQAFTQVAAMETGPGELVLLATNSPQGMIDAGLKDRLQRPHVREALAQMGWDWTVPLNLATLDSEQLAQFADEGPGAINTAGNSLLTFRLPQEVMRWGDKLREQHDGTVNHTKPLLAWQGVDGDDPEVLWRLAEIVGRQKLMTAFPDQKFAYRKTLREQMEKSKESLVRQAAPRDDGEKVHPQDKQRMEYLKALSEAVSNKQPSPESIERVARFVEPFDPLLSYFAHHEVAELLTRAAVPDPRSELQHRLYLAYFTDNRDKSVRNLAAALDLLASHPEAIPDPLERFDQFNGLLQMLKSRWEVRGLDPPKSVQFALNDVDKTVSAVEKSFDTMDRLAAELGKPVSDWSTRREFLETALVLPLRSYRHRLLPIHLKQQQRTEELLGKGRTADQKRTLGN